MFCKCFVDFLKLHKNKFFVLILLSVCFLLYFFFIPEMKYHFFNEGKFLLIAKSMFKNGDYLNLYLNGKLYFELPPLYFWIENLSFKIFNNTDLLSARLPSAFFATLGILPVYFIGTKTKSPLYGFICGLILATSFGYIVLAKAATIDMIHCFCISIAVYSGIYTLFCNTELKKYFWWISYIFTGFGVLCSGLASVVIPTVTVLFVYAVAGKLKEVFKPVHFLTGLGSFLLIIFFWHFYMFSTYGYPFFEEYFLKKFYYLFENTRQSTSQCYRMIFVFYLLPWLFYFVAQIILFFQIKNNTIKSYFYKFKELDDYEKIIFINCLYIFILLIVFILSVHKSPMQLLLWLYPISFIAGKFWYGYLCEKDNKNNNENENEDEKKNENSATAANLASLILIITLGCIIFLHKIAAGILISGQFGFLFLILLCTGIIYSILSKNRIMHFALIVIFSILITTCR